MPDGPARRLAGRCSGGHYYRHVGDRWACVNCPAAHPVGEQLRGTP